MAQKASATHRPSKVKERIGHSLVAFDAKRLSPIYFLPQGD
jgi:hypothetical protein